MLLNHSRRAARFRGGELVLLDDQDRSLWDQRQIVEARQLLERALALHGALVQAAIADLHTQEQRDWQQIALLYIRLEELTGSPIVTVNRAIALAQIEGPAAALALLDDLDLESYLYFHSTRADLLRRLGHHDEASAAYARAFQLAESEPERRFLQSRLRELDTRADDGSPASRRTPTHVIAPTDVSVRARAVRLRDKGVYLGGATYRKDGRHGKGHLPLPIWQERTAVPATEVRRPITTCC